MYAGTRFGAPWSRVLVARTVFLSLVLLGIAVVNVLLLPEQDPRRVLIGAGFPFLLWMAGLLSMVRGYEIVGTRLRVRRLVWRTTFDLTRLVSVEADPHAMARATTVFGNGGLFAFSGRFQSPELGVFQAYLTDPKRAVVLRFDDRTVVISPARPEFFRMRIQDFSQNTSHAKREPS